MEVSGPLYAPAIVLLVRSTHQYWLIMRLHLSSYRHGHLAEEESPLPYQELNHSYSVF